MADTMKKVLIIIGKLYVGGAERVGRDIGYFADPERFEIHYLVYGDDVGAYERELAEKGCRLIHMAPPSAGYAAYWRALTKLIRDEKYDVIHAHTMFSSGWAMMAGKKYGVPIRIAHSHSIRGNEKRGLVKNTYEKTMRRLVLRYATCCVGCGRGAGEWLFGAAAFREKGTLIYNGIGLDRFVFDAGIRRKRRGEAGLEDKFLIGHAGHLAQVKNQRFLLELMPRILEKKPNAFLLLLGGGADRAMLEEKIRELGLEDHVRMMGSVGNVHEWLSAMDVFVFPSLYEGTPLSILEVQANGLPCVISDSVPQDVFLTDLLHPMSLSDPKGKWVEAVLGARRGETGAYNRQLRNSDYAVETAMDKIYHIYDRGSKND